MDKLGKRNFYKLASDFFKDITFPPMKECEYFYCTLGKNECLSFPGHFIKRGIYDHIFIHERRS